MAVEMAATAVAIQSYDIEGATIGALFKAGKRTPGQPGSHALQ